VEPEGTAIAREWPINMFSMLMYTLHNNRGSAGS
jgi:hypothetical protein